MYIAHKSPDGRLQPLHDHLRQTASLAARFAGGFGAQEQAGQAGMLHDIGKYSPAGQRRMNDPEHTQKVDHATAGAQEAVKRGDACGGMVISAHHGGLKDKKDWKERIQKPLKNELDPSAFRQEVEIGEHCPPLPQGFTLDAFTVQAYIRMLFSCLIDADYLDTEAFMLGTPPPRGTGEALSALLERLEKQIEECFSHPQNALNEKRWEILQQCLRGDTLPRGAYTLTVPTGGGKTISSLAFALRHAVAHGLSHVIYVIPYTSIIEQNAAVFASLLGEPNVLEHHSNVDLGDEEDDAESESARRKRLACENWDAPIIVTTAVQFFESLFGNRTSSCRKLHNIANSVVIFDEAQMLPLNFLRPCVKMIAELTKHFGVTPVLCTATQPSLDRFFADEGVALREICEDTAGLYTFLRRTTLRPEGRMEEDVLALRLGETAQVLCIVNTKRRAQALFDALPPDGRFHLSTSMTPKHRTRTIAQIKERLKNGQTCRVVSTSLIEAGVDVDFPSVWREEAGLDSILQAAGRCNREGKQPREESIVHVFNIDQKAPERMAQQVECMRAATEGEAEMDGLAAIKDYFANLYFYRGEDGLDTEAIVDRCEAFEFETIAKKFKLIQENAVTIYIPTEENAKQLDMLRSGQLSKTLLRKLGQSAVNVYRKHYVELEMAGCLEITADGMAILQDVRRYHEDTGLELSVSSGEAFFA